MGRQYYVRQLRDMKWSPDPSKFNEAGLMLYATLCGHVLARAHARSGDAIALASYMGRSDAFERAIEDFCDSYVVTVAQDYQEFQDACASGRLASGDTTTDLAQYHAAMMTPIPPPPGG